MAAPHTGQLGISGKAHRYFSGRSQGRCRVIPCSISNHIPMAAARLALAARVGASSPPVGLEPPRLLRLRQGVRREAWFRLAVLALCGLAATGCGTPAPAVPRRTDAYLYEDTRRLVDFVESAATLIERRGTAAFAEFDRPGGRWRTAPTYLFVYDV